MPPKAKEAVKEASASAADAAAAQDNIEVGGTAAQPNLSDIAGQFKTLLAAMNALNQASKKA